MNRMVVVGVDGSASSWQALDLAAHEATLRGDPIRVVYAFVWTHLGPPSAAVRSRFEEELVRDAERVVRDAVQYVRERAPSAKVDGQTLAGPPAEVLIKQSCTASLVVVGNRGIGGFAGLLVGSVPVRLAAHAACPVLVAREQANPGGDILLGVDGSPANEPAVRFAFEEAALRRTGLTALYAWDAPVLAAPVAGPPMTHYSETVEEAERRVLVDSVACWHDKYATVPLRCQLVRGQTGRALIDASEQAQLVVVGSRGRGGFSGLLLGSVSQAVLQHAACPVAVVRHAHPG